MGRQDDEWDYYSESRPRKIDGGLKIRKERGPIGDTWWSKRWIQVLEEMGMGTRLTRGRSYARQGQVLSVDIQSGEVKAQVQGSRLKPYAITIRMQPLSEQEWDQVIEAMSAQALFAAKLLAGEMPTTIEVAFHSVSLSLFPDIEDDLITTCSCPDWANPCKHIAAVYYILAEQFDEDPFLLFKLRGHDKTMLIDALRAKRLASLPIEQTTTAQSESRASVGQTLLLENLLRTFWQAGDALDTFSITIQPQASDIDKAILKRLGEAPYSISGQNLATLLSTAYDQIQRQAREKAESLSSESDSSSVNEQ